MIRERQVNGGEGSGVPMRLTLGFVLLAALAASACGSSSPASPSVSTMTTMTGTSGFWDVRRFLRLDDGAAGLSGTMMAGTSWTITQTGETFTGTMKFAGYQGGTMTVAGTMAGADGHVHHDDAKQHHDDGRLHGDGNRYLRDGRHDDHAPCHLCRHEHLHRPVHRRADVDAPVARPTAPPNADAPHAQGASQGPFELHAARSPSCS